MDYFLSDEFDARAEELMKKSHIPGLSVAITQGKKTVSTSYGVACVSTEKPCTVDTLFDIASASKIMTAASVALLVEDDANHPGLKFDTSVSTLLPDDFVMSSEDYTRGVTLDDILGHRTGLASHDSATLGVNAAKQETVRSVTRNLRNLQTCAPIRSKHVYSNMMYSVATHLIESKTNMSHSDFLEKHFFKPLSMSSTSLQPATSQKKGHGERIATGHMWDEKENRYREFPAMDCPEDQGAGSIVTSVVDYMKFVKALLNQQHPISSEVYEGLTKIRSIPKPSAENSDPLNSPSFYCAGLHVSYYRGHAVMGHNGGVPGFGSRFCFVPSLQFACVFMANAIEAALISLELQWELIDSILDGRPGKSPSCKKASTASAPFFPRPCLKVQQKEHQKMPLDVYTGQYWNPGYHGIEVQIRDSQLYIDATDRSGPTELTLVHVSGQTHYVARVHLGEALGGMRDIDQIQAEFAFENDSVIKLGLKLEIGLDELIWFDRVQGEASTYQIV